MFAKQRQSLPIVADLVVGDLLLRDLRRVDLKSYSSKDLAPLANAWESLQEFVSECRPGALICGNDPAARDAYMRAFRAHEEKHPGATTDDFDLIYSPTYDDATFDARLAHLVFAVSQQGRFVGQFSLYNIKREAGSPEVLMISAMPSMGLDTSRGFMHPDDVGGILKALLEQDLQVVGKGRVIDLVEWRFPTRRAHAWVERKGGTFVDGALAKLSGHRRTDVSKDGESIPAKVRRA